MVFSSLSALKYLGGDCESTAALSPVDVPVFNSVPHAVEKGPRCVLSGSVVCQAQRLQPLSDLLQHASLWFQSSATASHGNRNPDSRYTQANTHSEGTGQPDRVDFTLRHDEDSKWWQIKPRWHESVRLSLTLRSGPSARCDHKKGNVYSEVRAPGPRTMSKDPLEWGFRLGCDVVRGRGRHM